MNGTGCDNCGGLGFLSPEKAKNMKDISLNGYGLPVCPVCKGKKLESYKEDK